MGVQPGFFDTEEQLRELSEAGDPLERLLAVVDFEVFRGDLDAALRRSDRRKGGRPPLDAVMMFKILVLQALYGLSDEATEYQVRDRLSFMRFLGLGLGDRVPDRTTVWLFREALVAAGAIEALFARFDAELKRQGYLALGGQIIDATIVEAPKQRLTAEEKATIKGGGTPAWPKAKARQKDTEARWTIKRGRVKRKPGPALTNPGGTPPETSERTAEALLIPAFGYIRTTSTSTGGSASSAASWSPTRRRTTAIGCRRCSMPTPSTAGFGPIPPIGHRPTSGRSRPPGVSRWFTFASRAAGRCRRCTAPPTGRARWCVPGSSIRSPSRNRGWVCSSERSGGPGRR